MKVVTTNNCILLEDSRPSKQSCLRHRSSKHTKITRIIAIALISIFAFAPSVYAAPQSKPDSSKDLFSDSLADFPYTINVHSCCVENSIPEHCLDLCQGNGDQFYGSHICKAAYEDIRIGCIKVMRSAIMYHRQKQQQPTEKPQQLFNYGLGSRSEDIGSRGSIGDKSKDKQRDYQYFDYTTFIMKDQANTDDGKGGKFFDKAEQAPFELVVNKNFANPRNLTPFFCLVTICMLQLLFDA